MPCDIDSRHTVQAVYALDSLLNSSSPSQVLSRRYHGVCHAVEKTSTQCHGHRRGERYDHVGQIINSEDATALCM